MWEKVWEIGEKTRLNWERLRKTTERRDTGHIWNSRGSWEEKKNSEKKNKYKEMRKWERENEVWGNRKRVFLTCGRGKCEWNTTGREKSEETKKDRREAAVTEEKIKKDRKQRTMKKIRQQEKEQLVMRETEVKGKVF